ncbi:helix-turn-helix domain-containing protein [Thiothrix lacustris]|uniref:Helix-turn-helix domain-containing protein n=1 Tax=Thiothrix lacustris TaxID=525917 RepID=A0ABY9MQS0_9GAMM|nr:helix-turn-helix domain-containing protein [Thiothrix lacustris]WML90998.1 helix-turn-helix domain-containing protein [Thiothrix lacustris]
MTETATSVGERTFATVQPGDLTSKLVECREKAGLDIEQAAEELHLSTHILRALEAEDFAHLPEPPYVRGYLRGYSKLTDVDAKELIRTYEALRGAKPDEIAHHFAPARPLNKVAQPAISTSTLKFIGFGALVLLLGLFSTIPGVRDWANHTWSSFSAQTNPPDVPRPPSAMEAYVAQKAAMEQEKDKAAAQEAQQQAAAKNTTEASIATTVTPVEPVPASSTQDTIATATTVDTTSVTPEAPIAPPTTTQTISPATPPADTAAATTAATTPATEGVAPSTAATAAADAAATALAPGEISIKMEFAQEVWMQIKGDDKKTLFESLNTAGNIKEFKATPPLNVKIGNAPGVKIFVNGQPFDLAPHTKGSVARFRVE